MVKGPNVIDEVHLNAFTSKVLSNADALYRFAYSVILDMESAFKIVQRVIESSTKQIEAIHNNPEPEVKKLMFKECWTEVKKSKVATSNNTLTQQLGKLAKIKVEQRAAVILTDIVGFEPGDAADIMAAKVGDVINHLVEARQALVS